MVESETDKRFCEPNFCSAKTWHDICKTVERTPIRKLYRKFATTILLANKLDSRSVTKICQWSVEWLVASSPAIYILVDPIAKQAQGNIHRQDKRPQKRILCSHVDRRLYSTWNGILDARARGLTSSLSSRSQQDDLILRDHQSQGCVLATVRIECT